MSSVGRTAGLASRLMQHVRSEAHAARRGTGEQCTKLARSFASGGHGGHNDAVTYKGLTLHKPARWHSVTGMAFSSLMWFWVFYRFYHDYDTFLFGHAQHYEHEIHAAEHEAHGAEHSKGH